MERYLSYEEYIGRGGALDASAFDSAELKARRRIDELTLGRVRRMAQVSEAVKAAMMEIMAVDAVYDAAAQAAAPLAASFTTDGYSESYGDADRRAAAVERRLNATVRRMLYGEVDDEGTALIYAGV